MLVIKDLVCVLMVDVCVVEGLDEVLRGVVKLWFLIDMRRLDERCGWTVKTEKTWVLKVQGVGF